MLNAYIYLNFQDRCLSRLFKKLQKSNQFTKKGSKLECDNYRPIVLLSHLDKIIEKLMFCTGHAVINVTEKIEKAIDNKMFVCRVFVDLHKAFDTVDQNILIHKL